MENRCQLLLLELLESSDSSSEDELFYLSAIAEQRVRPKIKNYIEDVVHNYSDSEFKRHFRLGRETVIKLIESFENSSHYPKYVAGRKRISAESHVLAFLWFAGNKCAIRDVAERFGTSESTFHRLMHRIMNFLLEIAPSIIKFPSPEEREKIEKAFQEVSGFPGVLGCLDGTYISIRTPAHKIKSTYVNRHDMTSVTLQAICGPDKKFLDVFTGPPSKIHDARVLKMSFIGQELEEKCSPNRHILADSAYPLRPWIMTPYKDYGNLTSAQKNFNYKLSSTRVKIENSFGILKSRFRQLIRTDFWHVNTITKFIICCVLHNICIENEDSWTDLYNEHFEDEEPLPEVERREQLLRRLGEEKRNLLCRQMLERN